MVGARFLARWPLLRQRHEADQKWDLWGILLISAFQLVIFEEFGRSILLGDKIERFWSCFM